MLIKKDKKNTLKDGLPINSCQLKSNDHLIWLLLIIGVLFPVGGCSFFPQKETSAQTQPNNLLTEEKITSVDVMVASIDSLTKNIEYIGTTEPHHQVSVRSQVEGRLLNLLVDVGDSVKQGQILANLDDNLLAMAVTREEAELATLESELASAKIQVKNAQIQLEEALVQLEQAENDAVRYVGLAKTGLIGQQQAESFQTAAKVAAKGVLSAREQVNIERQAVAAAQSRIVVQKAMIAEQKQRQAFSQLIAPIDGVVLSKASQPGNLIQPGEEVLQLGDFSRVKVTVPLSELDLGSIFLGQEVNITLDAFAAHSFTGRVTNIAPIADSTARQVSVELTVANPERQIKGGLLARVSFLAARQERIIVPESAILEENGMNYIFVLRGEEARQAQVEKQSVELGDRVNGKVEITTGIEPGTKLVVRSSKPLSNEESVRLSILSP